MRAELMTWPQVGAYFKDHDTVLLSVGSIENHGRQLPLGTDMLIPKKLLDLMESKTDWLIAPTLPFGSCDYFHEFPGTISLGDEILYQVLKKVIMGYYLHGARHFAILNGHGGNNPAINRIAYEMRDHDALVARLDWWTMVWDVNPAWKGGHGGGEETAAILAVDPSLVDWSAVDEMNLEPMSSELDSVSFMDVTFHGVKAAIPRLVTEVTGNGWVGPDHPKYATEEMGKEMLAACADHLTAFLNEFKTLPTEKKNFTR